MTTSWTIEELRESVAAHSYVCIGAGPPALEPGEDGAPDRDLAHLRGVTVDVQTANAIVTVFDALNAENQAKLLSLPIGRVADIAWKLVS